MLFCVLDRVPLHLALVDLELDLALILQLRQHHEGLIIVTIVDKSANLTDLLVSLNCLLDLIDTQSIVDLLLAAIVHLLQTLEVDHCRLHVVGCLLLLLLLLHLESHQALHLHELIWDHSKLLILRIIAGTLRIEHHLHVHIGVNIVHSLTAEGRHIVLHHHARELVHVLHAVHAHWLWHLIVSRTIAAVLSHFRLSWRACVRS